METYHEKTATCAKLMEEFIIVEKVTMSEFLHKCAEPQFTELE